MWSPTGATMLDLKVKLWKKSWLGGYHFGFYKKTQVQDGFLLRKMDATIHSNHPKLPRVPSSMLFFFGIFNLHKMLEQLLSHLKKNNHPPRGHSPH